MKDLTITGTYTDLYQLTMAQVYFLTGKNNDEAVFDYFFRKLPYEGGYTVFAGLGTFLDILEDLHFTRADIDYLKGIGLNEQFVNSLESFRFRGTIYAAREGEVVFPNEPVLRLQGNMMEAQIVETLLLNILNFQSLIATKAARMRTVAGDRTLSDFGLRRAQGTGGYHATRAAIVGGFDSTSNVKAALDFGIPAVGTMAHSFIQSYDDELAAFRDFAIHRPENCILLVDTYDTLKSGIPNAITVAKEMHEHSQQLLGVRLDSGDLAYLSKKTRKMLDEAGLHEVKITASNQLDEWVIKSLLDQQAPIDIFGVGTSLVTGPPDAALDGVYKLAYAHRKPRIKLSENLKKITLPDKKQVYRMINGEGNFFGADVITLADENVPDIMYHPVEPDKSLEIKGLTSEPLLHKVMDQGKIVFTPSLKEIAAYCQERLNMLPDEHKRFYYPHIYKVGLSEKLRHKRDEMKKYYKK
ncbi:Nicotinate phosphoribosyltransferase [Fulvivirga imtechensis AK7]|uniref:Nicotinate phosphoribosyltransferase n=1 Tax=Fulvivirga imtechensis AK7 TaxID=1237149 RepID=L8JM80_9BACT|nr:nicotinate phosphoribosyltransferase [Fulvivirga imtechensis]ELR68497.1 Nicotinate phosphoribosyltransferase [Fulvivirga imtechensis AK7]